MEDQAQEESWRQIQAILERGSREELVDFVNSHDPHEIARALNNLDEESQRAALTLLPREEAADLLEELHETIGADILEELPATDAAKIVEIMVSDERADVLAELDKEDAEAILQAMKPEEAREARRLLEYAPNTAGGIMVTEYLAYPETHTIADVLNDLRENAEKYHDYKVQHVYILDEGRRLVGVIRLRDLLLSKGSLSVSSIMIKNPHAVRVHDSIRDLEKFFDRHGFFGAPVLDNRDRLVGVVESADVEEALGEQADETFMRFGGIVGGEEFRSMPLKSRTMRRLSFLFPNILLNLMSASVIAVFEDTLRAALLLAIFLPMISDMSGCSGNQAVAVSIRELALGLIKPRDYLRVWWKEAQVGMLNGLALGAVLAMIASAFALYREQPAILGAVVGLALALNVNVAVWLGGLIPLMLNKVGVDPALASSPLLTTVTDMCNFFFTLGFAALLLSMGWI